MSTAYRQGYEDALAGYSARPAMAPATKTIAYLAGYRQARRDPKMIQHEISIPIPGDEWHTPRTEIILYVDAASYLRRYDKMEVGIADLATMLKHDAIRAVSEMDFRFFAADLVQDRGKSDIITTTELKDRYEEIEDEEESESAPLEEAEHDAQTL